MQFEMLTYITNRLTPENAYDIIKIQKEMRCDKQHDWPEFELQNVTALFTDSGQLLRFFHNDPDGF